MNQGSLYALYCCNLESIKLWYCTNLFKLTSQIEERMFIEESFRLAEENTLLGLLY